MAYAGEAFVERYGAEAASQAPRLRELVRLGIPTGMGTDGTRVASYNPWPAVAWAVTGRSLGGLQLLGPGDRLSRDEALALYTHGSAWFSGEETEKGVLAPGYLADFAVLDRDVFAVPDDRLAGTEALLTVVGGRPVYAAGPFADLDPALPPLQPAWSPVRAYGGVYTIPR